MYISDLKTSKYMEKNLFKTAFSIGALTENKSILK